jgi:hypothetical protein
MFQSFKTTSAPAKVLTISVALILAGLGLCGAGNYLNAYRISIPFLIAGAACFVFGSVGFIIAAIASGDKR